MSFWRLNEAYGHLHEHFGSLEQVFDVQGRRLTRDPLSEVILLEIDGVRYYVKRYWGAGKGLRRLVGRPRIKAEWQNLQHFARWGIPTAPIVGRGLERRMGFFVRGAMITREIEDTRSLAELVAHDDPRLRDAAWVQSISRQLAHHTRALHRHHFAHNDLKWRNLLVDGRGELFLIDCPSGTFWHWPLLRRRVVKDLACLDKVARRVLSRSQRLRFYLQYRERTRLTASDKQRVREILRFFEGRE